MKIAGGSVDFSQRGGLNGPPRNFEPCGWSEPFSFAREERFKIYPDGVVLGEEASPACISLLFCGSIFLPCACFLLGRFVNVHGIIFSVNRDKNCVDCTICCKHWNSEEVQLLPNVQLVDMQIVRKVEIPYRPADENSHSVPRHDKLFEVMHITYLDNDGTVKIYTTKELQHPRLHAYDCHQNEGFFAAPTFTPGAFPQTGNYTAAANAVNSLIANNPAGMQQLQQVLNRPYDPQQLPAPSMVMVPVGQPSFQQPPQPQLMYRPGDPQQSKVQAAQSGYAMVPLGQDPVYAVATAVPVREY